MTGGHLGKRMTALVDGELDHDARDRALAHVAVCALCRAELDQLRRVAARVRQLPGPPPPVDLTRRLLALAEPGDRLPHRPTQASGAAHRHPVASPRVAARLAARPAAERAARPSPPRPAEGSAGRRVQVFAVASLSVFAVTMSTASVVGDEPAASLTRPALREAGGSPAIVAGVSPAVSPLTPAAGLDAGRLGGVGVVQATYDGGFLGSASVAPVTFEPAYDPGAPGGASLAGPAEPSWLAPVGWQGR